MGIIGHQIIGNNGKSLGWVLAESQDDGGEFVTLRRPDDEDEGERLVDWRSH